MKQIEARDQVRLSLYRCFEVCINGIYYRLFRSMVTVSIVVLTVAFFSNVVIEGIMTHGVAGGVKHQRIISRKDAWFIGKLTEVDSLPALIERLAATPPGARLCREIQKIARLDSGTLDDLLDMSRETQRYLRFFDQELSYGKRQILVQGHTGLEVFTYLQDPKHFSDFTSQLKVLKSVRLPTNLDVFRTFLSHYSGFLDRLRRIQTAYRRVVARITARYPIQELKRRIIAKDPDLLAFVRAQGFLVSDTEFAQIARQLDATEKILRIVQAVQNFTFKTRFINRYSILAKQYTPTRVMKKLRKRSGAEWFVAQCKKIPLPVTYPAAEIRALAREFMARNTLREVENKLGARGDWRHGIDKRTLWLMIISFIVCAVGIANAMLISVAERFREIATMKCLGALDGFVMTLFVMESGIFGLAGGLLGVVMGLLLSLFKEFMAFGRYAFLFFPGTHVLVGIFGALALGMFIAMLAALYPSWVASRMAPMEAMRVE